MKFRVITLFLIVSLLLTGCSVSAIRHGLDAAEDVLENRADAFEDAVESAVVQAPNPTGTQPAATITREQAEAIALENAGFTADQVTRLRTEYEIDDGIPRYEVQFHQGRWEYDYEIHADTGAILSYDRDD